MKYYRPFILAVWAVLSAFLVRTAFANNSPTSSLALTPWTADSTSLAQSSDRVVLGEIEATFVTRGRSWNTASSIIRLEKALKGDATKKVKFETVFMEDGETQEVNSMWALECGVTVRGDDARKSFAAMQRNVQLHKGQRAVVFLKSIRGRWRMLAMYPETEADAFNSAVRAGAVRKKPDGIGDNPLQFTISLPEREFANSAIIPVRCVLANRSSKKVVLEPGVFPIESSIGLLPILCSEQSRLHKFSVKGKQVLFPERNFSHGPPRVISPKKQIVVWVNLRDYFDIPSGEWKVMICLDLKYQVGVESYDPERGNLRRSVYPSQYLDFLIHPG